MRLALWAVPIAALVAVGTTAVGCGQGSLGQGCVDPQVPCPSIPTLPNDGGTAEAEAGPSACPDLQPTFSSFLTKVASTSTCGTNMQFNCHSSSGAGVMGTGNLLDFTLDAGAVYTELLGPDGGGAPSTNLAGNAGHIPRVVPGDAGASMLYIKLTLTSSSDPKYGSGMPLTAPGSLCPAVTDAVKTWIDQGAANN
jgi:hypothetical protein